MVRPRFPRLLAVIATLAMVIAATALVVTAAFSYFTYDRGRAVNIVRCTLTYSADNDVALNEGLDAAIAQDPEALTEARRRARITRRALDHVDELCADGTYTRPEGLPPPDN